MQMNWNVETMCHTSNTRQVIFSKRVHMSHVCTHTTEFQRLPVTGSRATTMSGIVNGS